jgi:hypothetical protein
MPPAAFVALGAAPAIAAFLSSLAVTLVTTALTTVVGMLLQKKPRKNPLTMDDRTITVRQPLSPRQIVQGAARVGGTIFFLERLGTAVWIGIIWSAEEIKGIDSIYADDEQIFFNGDGSAFGARNGEIRAYHHLGDPDQTVDEALNASFPTKWTTDHRVRGRAYTIIELVNLSGNWDNNIPNFSASIRGGLRYDPRTGLTDYNTNSALAILHFLTDEKYGYGSVVKLEDIDINNFAAEANICDEEVALPAWEDTFTMSSGRAFTVNTTTDFITFTGGGFDTGTAIYVISSGTLPAPLVVSTLYYVKKTVDWNGGGGAIPTITFTLHPTLADAQAGTNGINFTTTGTGTHTTIEQFTRFQLTGNEMGFSGNATTDVITPDEFIWKPRTGAGFAVIILETTGTLAANLEEGVKYLWNCTTTTIFEYGNSSNQITYTTGSTGTFTMRIVAYADVLVGASDVDVANSTIQLALEDSIGPIYPGLPVKITDNTPPGVPSPLVSGEIYFVIPTSDPIKIKLAASRADAIAGRNISLTDDGGGGFMVESMELTQDKVSGFTTGMACEVYPQSGATLPSPLAEDTTYYIVRTGQTSFSLATTRRNALDGVVIGMTDSGDNTSDGWAIRLLSEPRYTACGIYDTDQDKGDVLRGLLSSCAGRLLPPVGGDKWKLAVGAYRLPLVDLDERDAVGGISLNTRRPRRETCNTVKGTYAGPRNFDQPANLPVVSNSRYIEEDGGEELAIEMNLPFTESEFMGTRILKIELERRRKQMSVSFPTTLMKGLQIEPTDGVDLSWARFELTDKNFEVAEWKFSVESSGEDEPPIPRVELELIEMGPDVYE